MTLDVDHEHFAACVKVIIAAGTASVLKMLGAVQEQVEPMTWALNEMAGGIDGADYVLAIDQLQRSSRVIARMFSRYDVLISPVVSEPPPLLGHFQHLCAPGSPCQRYGAARHVRAVVLE